MVYNKKHKKQKTPTGVRVCITFRLQIKLQLKIYQ